MPVKRKPRLIKKLAKPRMTATVNLPSKTPRRKPSKRRS